MAKFFNTAVSDCTTRINDSAAATTTLIKALINEGIRFVNDVCDLEYGRM